MAGPLRYTYPAENIAKLGTWTLVTGTQSVGTSPRDYLPPRLFDDDPAHPFKSDSTTIRLLCDFGTAVPIAVLALIHHNLAAGLTGVSVDMGSTSATSSVSYPLVIPAYMEDKFPTNVLLDLSAAIPVYRYLSFNVSVANA